MRTDQFLPPIEISFESKLKGITIALVIFLINSTLSLTFAQEDTTSTDIDLVDTVSDNNFKLIMAAYDGDEIQLKSLIARGADVNTRTYNEGVTPLIYACQNNHLECVKLLMENGANPEQKANDGNTALIGCGIMGNDTIAEYLINHGVNLHAKGYSGATALHWAARNGHYIMVDMLLYFSANVNEVDYYGTTPLMAAAFNGNIEIAELLIKNNADINKADLEGYTALMYAVESRRSDMVKLFIDNRADVDTVATDNHTALTIAATLGSSILADSLVKSGANVNHVIKDWPYIVNALSIAQDRSDKKMKKVLISAGAENNIKPAFSRLNFSLLTIGNHRDFFLGAQTGITDFKYLFDISLGYQIRPWRNRILVEQPEGYYYQFWERRSLLFLSVGKTVRLWQSPENFVLGFCIAAKEVYSFGSYRGMNEKAEKKLITVPSLGISWGSRDGFVQIRYEYMQLGILKVPDHWVSICFGFSINMHDPPAISKKAYWIY